MQFLIETLLMTVGGGIAGIVIGARGVGRDLRVCGMVDARVADGGVARLRRVVPGRTGLRVVSRDEGRGTPAGRRDALRVVRRPLFTG